MGAFLDSITEFAFEKLTAGQPPPNTTHQVTVNNNVNRAILVSIQGTDGYMSPPQASKKGNPNVTYPIAGAVVAGDASTYTNTSNANDGTQPDHTTNDQQPGNALGGGAHASVLSEILNLGGTLSVGSLKFSIATINDQANINANGGDSWRIFGSTTGLTASWTQLAQGALGANDGTGTIVDITQALVTSLYSFFRLEVYCGVSFSGASICQIWDFRVYDTNGIEIRGQVASITYPGGSLQKLVSGNRNSGGGEIWAMLAPTVGVNQNLTIAWIQENYSGSLNPGTVKISVFSLFNVVQDLTSASVAVVTGNNANASITYNITPKTAHGLLIAAVLYGLTTTDAAAAVTKTYTSAFDRNTNPLGGTGHTFLNAAGEYNELNSIAATSGTFLESNATSNTVVTAVTLALTPVVGGPVESVPTNFPSGILQIITAQVRSIASPVPPYSPSSRDYIEPQKPRVDYVTYLLHGVGRSDTPIFQVIESGPGYLESSDIFKVLRTTLIVLLSSPPPQSPPVLPGLPSQHPVQYKYRGKLHK